MAENQTNSERILTTSVRIPLTAMDKQKLADIKAEAERIVLRRGYSIAWITEGDSEAGYCRPNKLVDYW